MDVWSVWRPRRVGGFISAAVQSVGTSVAVTVLRASMHLSMRPTGHPIIASFEPGEDWFFNYEKQDYEKPAMIKGVELLPPHSHPKNQPAPGPAGRVPANWESLLN